MKIVVYSLGALLSGASHGSAQSASAACQANDTARSLCAVDAQVTDALRRNDVDRLTSLYGDDFHLINFRGRLIDKAGVLAALKSGALHFDSLTSSDLQVRVYQSTGVITGTQHQVAREPGGDGQAHPKDVRFTHVYVRQGDVWRLVSSQITPIVTSPER